LKRARRAAPERSGQSSCVGTKGRPKGGGQSTESDQRIGKTNRALGGGRGSRPFWKLDKGGGYKELLKRKKGG